MIVIIAIHLPDESMIIITTIRQLKHGLDSFYILRKSVSTFFRLIGAIVKKIDTLFGEKNRLNGNKYN